MELVGRRTELAAVERALEAVRGGETRVLAVVGEAGIGKSALLAATAEAASPMLVVAERAAEHERGVPFAFAAEALERHTASLHPALLQTVWHEAGISMPATRCAEGLNSAERYRIHRAQRAIVELLGRSRPVVLVLDDLQWADEASVELLVHMLRRPAAVAHLVAFAARPGPAALRLLDAARAAPGFEQLELRPLDDAAADRMLAGVPDRALRERYRREAAGNPLFLRELARTPGGGALLPTTLQAAVALELRTLAADARTLLAGAAVAGDPFDPELAAIAAGAADARALDALVAADLVREHAGARGFVFRHPLVRRAVYDATPRGWRLGAHERVAGALERRGERAEVRAYHVAKCARPGDRAAVAVLVRAAEATARSSPATAADWYGVALPLLPEGERAPLLAPRTLALAAAGRLEESLTCLREALAVHPGDRELVLARSRVELLRGRDAQSRRRLHAAYDARPHAALAFELAAAAMSDGDGPALRTWAAAARGAGAPLEAGARVLAALGTVWAGERAPEDDLLAPLRALDDDVLGAHPTVLLHVSRAVVRLERIDEATETIRRGIAIGRASISGEMLVWLLAVQAWALWLQLDLHGARTAAEAAVETARLQAAPNPLLLALSVRAAVEHERGETVQAHQAAADCAALIASLEPSATTRTAAATIAAVHVDDDPERCRRELAGIDLEPSSAGRSLLVRVRAALAAGNVDDADRLAREAATHSALFALPHTAARAEAATAEVLLAHGEPEAAAALAACAAEASVALDAAHARLLEGRALAAASRLEAAKTVLQRVAADAALGGATRLRRAAARELRALGARASAEVHRGERAPLSARERQVAELVAAGRSNRQVAAALYLSEKTVENALTRVYAKVGVRSRSQLARAWAQQLT